jgi:predicted alpha/beta superfamily hydrolase
MNALISLLAVITAGTVSPGQNAGIEGVQNLGDSRHHTFDSQTLDKNFHIVVGLPVDYSESGNTEYPTVYVLDGGVHYATLRGYHRYLRNGEEVPEIILVAISYGTNDWQNGNSRSEDYTAPSDESEYWGGAGDFQDFLGSELIPFIESAYRSKSDRRVIFGQSIAGQFVLYTAQTRPTLFWGHIASNPALHRNLPLFLQMHPATPADGIESRLYVASGSDDDPRFREPALQWMNHWTNTQERPWNLRAETLDGHNHFSAPPASFRQGMKWLFSGSDN